MWRLLFDLQQWFLRLTFIFKVDRSMLKDWFKSKPQKDGWGRVCIKAGDCLNWISCGPIPKCDYPCKFCHYWTGYGKEERAIRTNMKKQLLEFLDIEKKVPKKFKALIETKNHENEELIAEYAEKAMFIAPLTARKLLEAVELLQFVWDCYDNNNLHMISEIKDYIKRILEDFNNTEELKRE